LFSILDDSVELLNLPNIYWHVSQLVFSKFYLYVFWIYKP